MTTFGKGKGSVKMASH